MYPYYNLALNFNKINLPLQTIKPFHALHFIVDFYNQILNNNHLSIIKEFINPIEFVHKQNIGMAKIDVNLSISLIRFT